MSIQYLNVLFNLSVQAYIALSSMSQWGTCHDLVNLCDFYNTIVATFERNPDDPWVVETLEWWNEYVFILLRYTNKELLTDIS